VLDVIGAQSVNEGSLLTVTPVASDVDVPAQTLTFSLQGSVPTGFVINSVSGVMTWTPSESQGGTVSSITIRVSDSGSPSLFAERTFSVTVGEVNSAPVLAAIGAKSVNEGALLSFTATATDSDIPAQALTFSLQGSVPSGAAITSAGAFTWTPSSTQGSATPYQITVRVTDNGAGALYDEETIAVTVVDVHAQVTFVAAGTGSGTTGNPTPAYPAGLQANDLLLLQVTVNDSATTPTTPGGWSLLYGPDNVPGTGTAIGRQWIYYKFTTGTETSPLTVTIGGTAAKSACIYAFRNVATGTPANFVESAVYAGSPTTPTATIPASSVTTTGEKELVVSFNYVQADFAMGSFTGATGGTWAQPTGGLYRYTGNTTLQLQTATMANAGTISGGTTANYNLGGGNYASWGVRAFALKPA
jgi:hypothetical protein